MFAGARIFFLLASCGCQAQEAQVVWITSMSSSKGPESCTEACSATVGTKCLQQAWSQEEQRDALTSHLTCEELHPRDGEDAPWFSGGRCYFGDGFQCDSTLKIKDGHSRRVCPCETSTTPNVMWIKSMSSNDGKESCTLTCLKRDAKCVQQAWSSDEQSRAVARFNNCKEVRECDNCADAPWFRGGHCWMGTGFQCDSTLVTGPPQGIVDHSNRVCPCEVFATTTTTTTTQVTAKLQKTKEDLQKTEGDLQKVKNEKRKLDEDNKKLLSEVLFSADKEKKELSDKVFQAEAKIANLEERMQKTQDTDLKSKELLLEMLRSATKEKEELSGKMTKAEAQFEKYQEAYEKLYKGCAEFTTASTCPGQPRCLWTGTSCEVPKSQRDEFFLKSVAAIMIVVVCAAFVIKAFYPGAGALHPLGAASFVVLVFLAMLLANSEAVGLFLQVLGQAMAAVFQAWGVPPAPPR